MTLIQCAATSWAGLVICRVLMGLFEAGFFAGLIFFLTLFYKRDELAFRIAMLYAAATIAGAFSGLLAFGVFQIGDPHVQGWKWLFIIEGGATIIIAGFAYWRIPKSPSTCSWLTEAEKALALARMRSDGSSEVDEKFDLKIALRALLNWRIMAWAAIGFCYGESGSAVGNFLPQFVARLVSVNSHLYVMCYKCIFSNVCLQRRD
jgi:MFS family permease